jgi:sulfonate dioxygenase
MSAFTLRVAQAALQPLLWKPPRRVREYSFWFGIHTMAPSIDVPSPYQNRLTPRKTVANYVPGHTFLEKHTDYEYEDLKPHYPDVKWPALEEVPYEDKGLLGDPYFRNLKEIATGIVDYIPKIGTEVCGVDLADLTDDQKNDIARLIAIRGVVFFRNQKNFGVEEQRKLGAYFRYTPQACNNIFS